MKYKIMEFSANRNYEGKEIEVVKISNISTKVTNRDLILQMSRKLDKHDQMFKMIFEKLDKHDQMFKMIFEKLDKHDQMFKMIFEKLDKHDKIFKQIFDILKRNNLK